jgi:hypothetical protein
MKMKKGKHSTFNIQYSTLKDSEAIIWEFNEGAGGKRRTDPHFSFKHPDSQTEFPNRSAPIVQSRQLHHRRSWLIL